MQLPITQDERYQNAFRKRLRVTHPNRGTAIAMLGVGVMLIVLILVGLHADSLKTQNAAIEQHRQENSL
jgi:hypothetical protein